MFISPNKKRKTRPRFVWASRVNLGGLFHTAPIKCVWSRELESYWGEVECQDSQQDNEEDDYVEIEVKKIGLDIDDEYNYVTFSSTSKEEVSAWIKGVKSTMTLLNSWSHSNYRSLKNLE